MRSLAECDSPPLCRCCSRLSWWITIVLLVWGLVACQVFVREVGAPLATEQIPTMFKSSFNPSHHHSREKWHTPPALPPCLASWRFQGCLCIFWSLPRQDFYTAPLFYTPPTPRKSIFRGEGAWVHKFGPPTLPRLRGVASKKILSSTLVQGSLTGTCKHCPFTNSHLVHWFRNSNSWRQGSCSAKQGSSPTAICVFFVFLQSWSGASWHH